MSSRNKLFLKPIDVEDFTNKGCDQPHASHQSLFHLRSFNRVDSRGGWFGYVRMVLPKKRFLRVCFNRFHLSKVWKIFPTNITDTFSCTFSENFSPNLRQFPGLFCHQGPGCQKRYHVETRERVVKCHVLRGSFGDVTNMG